MASSISLPRVGSGSPLLNALRIVPGVLLLAGSDTPVRFWSCSGNAYAKAHQLDVSQHRVCFVAILIGLVISNT